jgi:hypothetical protein
MRGKLFAECTHRPADGKPVQFVSCVVPAQTQVLEAVDATWRLSGKPLCLWEKGWDEG